MPIEDEPEEQSEQERAVRYWTPRLIAAVIMLALLLPGLFGGGREAMAFFANWSTFCLQAGAIYLFLFQQEFLANLVLDIMDYVQRVRAWRAARAAEREAARAKKTKPAQAASGVAVAVAAQAPSKPANEQTPSPELVAPAPVAPAGPRPRFNSRNRAVWPRAAIGVAFVALLGLVLLNPIGTREPEGSDAKAEAVTPTPEAAAEPSPEPIEAAPAPVAYRVTDTSRCYTLAAQCTGDGRRWVELGPPLNDIDVSNPSYCLIRAGETIQRPGDWNCPP